MLMVHEWTGHSSYDSLAVASFGPRWAVLIPITNAFAIFGACTGYIKIILSQLDSLGWPKLISQSFQDILHNQPLNSGIILFGVIVLPLCMLKDLAALKYTSIFGFICSLFLISMIIAEGLEHEGVANRFGGKNDDDEGWHPAEFNNGLSQAAALINFAFVVHLNIIPAYAGLQGPSKNPEQMRSIIRTVVATCFILYFFVGCISYSVYQGHLQDNILENLADNWLTYIARTSIVLVTLCSFPLLFFPLRMTLHQLVLGPPHTVLMCLRSNENHEQSQDITRAVEVGQE
jgi:amino acid permease